MKRALKITGIVLLSIIVVILALAGYGWYKLRHVKDTHDLAAQVNQACKAHIAKGRAAGLFVGIIQGDTVFAMGYGVADKITGTHPDSNTVFEIGSITKVFTSLMTEKLAEQGIVNWQDNIIQHMPAGIKLYVNDTTTLEHLATHTSGFPRLPERWFPILERDTCDPYSPLTMQDLISYLDSCTDKKRPSKANYDYSNMGAGLLGHILEWKTGKTYQALLQELICRPLNMHRTSILMADSGVIAMGYDAAGKKTCHWRFPVLYGCGAIKSTGADMLRFLAAQINAPAGSAIERAQKPVVTMPGGSVGHGWHIDAFSSTITGLPPIVWHNGATGGFHSYIGFMPGTGRGIVVLANQADEGLDALGVSLLTRVGRISLY
jgi:serine-type D-Ala-D-Ala carboxypeptidase/endopeptidase